MKIFRTCETHENTDFETEISQGDPTERITLNSSLSDFIDFQKMPQFHKIKKMANLFHGDKQGISISEILVFLNFNPS